MTDPSESADGSMQSVLVSWRGTGLEYAPPGYLTATARGFIVSFSLGDIAGGQDSIRNDGGAVLCQENQQHQSPQNDLQKATHMRDSALHWSLSQTRPESNQAQIVQELTDALI